MNPLLNTPNGTIVKIVSFFCPNEQPYANCDTSINVEIPLNKAFSR